LFSGDLRKYGLTKAMSRSKKDENWFTRISHSYCLATL
jgi:hypothetical protein